MKNIGISEHKIQQDSFLNQNLPGYTFEFQPTKSTHGGVGFFIHNCLTYKLRNDLLITLDDCVESIFIELIFENKKNIILGCIYRHPHCSINDFCDNYITDLLNHISHIDKPCILMGDFNIDLLKSNSNNATAKFLEIMNSSFFLPFIQKPSRVTDFSAILIDNIFMNTLDYETISGNILCQIADHLLQFLILSKFEYRQNTSNSNTMKRNFTFFNNDEFRNEIKQINWNNIFETDDLDKCFHSFISKLNFHLDEHAPIKTLSKKEHSLASKPWISKRIRNLMFQRDKIFKKFCKAHNIIVKNRYRK